MSNAARQSLCSFKTAHKFVRTTGSTVVMLTSTGGAILQSSRHLILISTHHAILRL